MIPLGCNNFSDFSNFAACGSLESNAQYYECVVPVSSGLKGFYSEIVVFNTLISHWDRFWKVVVWLWNIG